MWRPSYNVEGRLCIVEVSDWRPYCTVEAVQYAVPLQTHVLE